MRSARDYWDKENLLGLLDDMNVLFEEKVKVKEKHTMLSAFTGRTKAAIKQALHRASTKK